MAVFSVVGESASGLEVSMVDPADYDRCWYLVPDVSLTHPDQQARELAADAWKPVGFKAEQSKHVRSKAYFQDALGVSLPGCCTCVSDTARAKLEPSLGDQVRFLPVNIDGAPMPYWMLYATRFYSNIDLGRSRVNVPAAYMNDKRLQLREPYFPESSELEELFIFRVAGTEPAPVA